MTSPPLRLRPWMIALYLVAYVASDGLSYINEMVPIGVTPWNPPPGFSLAFVMLFGWPAAPWVLGALLAADATLRGMPSPVIGAVGADMALAATYILAGLALRRLRVDAGLERQRDIVALLAVGVIAALVGALGAVSSYIAAGMLDAARFTQALFRFWVGDAVGIAVTTPLVLLAISRKWRPASLADIPFNLETLTQMAALAFTQWVVYNFELDTGFRFLYPLSVPMVWIAVRHGLTGAVLGALAMQTGFSVACAASQQDAAKVTDLQFALLAFTITAHLVGVVVSERRQAATAVLLSERRLRSLFAVAPVGIAEIDRAGRVMAVNAALETMTAAPAAHLLGQPALAVLPGLGRVAAAGRREVELTQGPVPRWLEVSVADIPTDMSGGTAHIAVYSDISERKELVRRQQAHQAEMASAARVNAAGELSSVMAHELNQPLASIIYYLRAGKRLMEQPDGLKDAGEAVDWAVAQAVRASDIIRNLRSFFIRGDRTATAMDVRTAIHGAAEFLAADAQPLRAALVLDLPAEALPAVIDRIQLEQVLLNLLRNAAEALAGLPHDGTLRVRAIRENNAVAIDVTDDGPGIPQSIRDDLFKPFTTTRPEGMGLGLAISRSIIEACGGSLTLAGTGPDGTTFAIRLPLAVPAVLG